MLHEGTTTGTRKIRELIEQLKRKIGELRRQVAELEENVKVLINAASDSAFLIDTSGNILAINEAAARKFGRPVEKLIGTNIFSYYSAEERGFREAYMEVVKHSRQPVHFEDEYQGTIFSTCIHPVLNSQGSIDRFAFFFNDITEHKRSQDALYRYSQIFSTVHDPMAYVDRGHIVRTVNDAFLEMLCKDKEDVIGRPVAEVFGKEIFRSQVKISINRCLKGEKVHYQDWFRLPDGQKRFMYMSFYPLLSKEQTVSGAVINAVDITKNRQQEEELQRLSFTDPLTNIFNRARFRQVLEEEIQRVNRYQTDLSLIMFDIDHFKSINDSHGHDVGDKVLVAMADIVKNCIRESDILCRWGGEEFMILLPHAGLDNASGLAERIRQTIAKSLMGEVGAVTCSFGAAQYCRGEDADSLIKRVDKALYKAKRKGRNRVEIDR